MSPFARHSLWFSACRTMSVWKKNQTYHNSQIHRFDSRMAASSDIVASSSWSPRKSYSNQMACASYPSPKWNGPMLQATKCSIQLDIAMKMQQIKLPESNHPNILMAHLLVIKRRKSNRESSRTCSKKKKQR